MVERVEAQKLPPSGTPMTMEEYEALPETMVRMELINGIVVYPFGYPGEENDIMVPAPALGHQDKLFGLAKLIDRTAPGGKVWIAPVDVYFDDDNYVQPDILWVAEDSRCVPDAGKRLRGAPDLIVEIASPGTAIYDRRDKFNLYQRFGVREYWIADPQAKYVEVYRHENGVFVRQGVYGPDETFESAVLGKPVDLKGIFD